MGAVAAACAGISTFRIALAGAVMIGFGLRLWAMGASAFSADEAIYSVWALHAWRGDPLFLDIWPDKPPLFLWALGAWLTAAGNRPEVAQFLNICISTLTIAVVGAIGRDLWGRTAGAITALLLALNPFAVSFAPTAFTDPLLVLGGMAALWAAIRGRGFAAGLWLGVAVMTKQTGVLYVPLIVGALWLHRPRMTPLPGMTARAVAGALAVIGPIVLWDSLRWAVAPSPWDLSVRNYGAMALASPALWADRLAGWWQQLYFLQADNAAWLLTLTLWVTAAGIAWRARRERTTREQSVWDVALIGLWSGGFLALHLTSTIQIWDRYLLPLAPMWALLLAWAIGTVAARMPIGRRPSILLLTGIAALLLMGPATTAAAGGLPVGGDKGAYTGIGHAVAWMSENLETPFVLYHTQLGWHFQYYLFDAVATGQVELRWFPSTTYLADNVEKTPHRPLLYLEARWAPQRDLAQRLAMRNLALRQRGRFDQFVLYEIAPKANAPDGGPPLCAWCFSQEAPPAPPPHGVTP